MSSFLTSLRAAEVGAAPSAAIPFEKPEAAVLVLSVYILLGLAGLVVDVWLWRRALRSADDWAEAVSRLQWRPWSLREFRLLFSVVLLLLAFSVLTVSLTAKLAGLAEGSRPGLQMSVQSFFIHWPVLGALAWWVVRRRKSWGGAFGLEGRRWLRDLLTGAMFYVGALPFVLFYSILYQLVLRGLGIEPTMQDVALVVTEDESYPVRIYLWVLALLVAPVVEELLFRGVALPVAVKHWGVGRGVTVVALAFAVIHLHLPSIVPLFIIAVAFSLAYIHTGSILVPIAMHALFNGVNLWLLAAVRGM